MNELVATAETAVVILRLVTARHKFCRVNGRLGEWETLYGRAIDGFSCPTDDSPMNEAVYTSSRRSQRVFHRMRLQAKGRSHAHRKFRETCESQVVNAHGGLLYLKNEVDPGELLVLINPETLEEQECRIVFVGEPGARGQRVGVEFLTPAPHFWGIDFDAQALPRNAAPDNSN